MRDDVRKVLKAVHIYDPLRDLAVMLHERGAVAEWEKNGRPAPPPYAIKQQVLLDHAGRYGLRVLVETGTYYGDMVRAMKDHFDAVYSIELRTELYERARRRFKRSRNVTLIQGDSAEKIGEIVRGLDRPALFWLDGHYSGGETAKGQFETPVLAELERILESRVNGHVVIIDDAREFGTDPAYPTIDELRAFVEAKNSDLDMRVELDSIRMTPRSH